MISYKGTGVQGLKQANNKVKIKVDKGTIIWYNDIEK